MTPIGPKLTQTMEKLWDKHI